MSEMRCCVFVCLYTHSSCCWVVRERRERKDETHKVRRGEERRGEDKKFEGWGFAFFICRWSLYKNGIFSTVSLRMSYGLA